MRENQLAQQRQTQMLEMLMQRIGTQPTSPAISVMSCPSAVLPIAAATGEQQMRTNRAVMHVLAPGAQRHCCL